LKIAALKSGDVVFVSAAAGAVGSVACQIAKLKGHKVIGSAGGANKCAFLRHIGVDHVIDYKATSNLTDALLRAASNGIDVYFDNVGGNHLEAALAVANRFARFVLCGMISQYNTVGLPEGPRNIMFVIGKCIRLEGLDVANYFNLLPEFHRDLSGWIRDGKLVWKESVEEGIENAPESLPQALQGRELRKDAGETGVTRSSRETHHRTYRPNTWQHRPSLRREDTSCQPGAVHTWHFSDVADLTDSARYWHI
jgi:NADPH-dependent curcumin reductase CurA